MGTTIGRLPQAGRARLSPTAEMPATTAFAADPPAALAAGFRAGEAEATERVVAVYYPRIARTIHRLAGWSRNWDVADTDDLVQEVFVRALMRRRQFRGQSDLGTWLTSIAINVCRGHYRKMQVRRVLMAAFAAAQPTDPATDQTDDDASQATREAVARLPTRFREVIVLHHLEEYAVEEVAQMLGLSKSAVHKRLSRARARLAEMLSPAS